jgi:peptidoglycan/xylan/chitin deacetylase (PgdA/CDA1 family)
MYSLPENLIKDAGTLVEDFEDHTDWVANHGSKADDAVNYKTGTQGIKVTSAVGDEGEIQRSSLTWDPIGDKETRFWFYIADLSLLSTSSSKIQLYDSVGGYADRKEVIHYIFEGWNLVKIGPQDWDVKGSGSLSDDINYIRLRTVGTAGNQGIITYDSLYMQQISEPAVVITFDDAKETVYDTAYPIMRDGNMVGTVYCITDHVGTPDNMTWAELLELQAAGWCIANHSEDHADLTGLTEAQVETNLSNAIAALQGAGVTGNGPYHVAYPGGAYNDTVEKACSDINILTARTIYKPARHPALPMDRPYEIPILVALDNGTNLATAKGHIDDLVANGTIGYIYGHDIEAAAGPDDWAESDFTELCDYIAAKRMASLTIEDCYQLQSGSRMVRKAR